jgi:hypothetical protein
MGEKLNTKQAAKFCTEHGRPTEEATLNTLRSTGGGPPFYKEDGKKTIMYDTDDLLEWCKTPSWKKYNSTSEYSTRKKKPPKPEEETPKPNGAPPEDKPPEDKPSEPLSNDGGDNE